MCFFSISIPCPLPSEKSKETENGILHPIPSRHRLWLRLRRYLIVFDPPTFVLDLWKHLCGMLSLSSIFSWSLNFTSLRKISTTPFVPILCLSHGWTSLRLPHTSQGRPISHPTGLFLCPRCLCLSVCVTTHSFQQCPLWQKQHVFHLPPFYTPSKPFPQTQPPQISCPLPCAPFWHAIKHLYYPMLIYPSYSSIYLYRPILFKVFHPVLPYRPSKHNLQTAPPVLSCHPVCETMPKNMVLHTTQQTKPSHKLRAF